MKKRPVNKQQTFFGAGRENIYETIIRCVIFVPACHLHVLSRSVSTSHSKAGNRNLLYNPEPIFDILISFSYARACNEATQSAAAATAKSFSSSSGLLFGVKIVVKPNYVSVRVVWGRRILRMAAAMPFSLPNSFRLSGTRLARSFSFGCHSAPRGALQGKFLCGI